MTGKHAVILILLIVFTVAGCKGKEEKQPVTEAPVSGLSEQTGREVAPMPSESAPSGAVTGDQQAPGNAPPRIAKFNITPQKPALGDTIKAEVVTTDRDGDDVEVTYQWSMDDALLPESSESLSLSPGRFKQGDKISLRVTPNDGKSNGTPMTMIIPIGNASPVIESSRDTFRFEGSVYSFQVKAADPDGDPLTYSLKSAPSGMTINEKTGLVQWNVPSDFKGKAPVTVAVSDGHGGETLEAFTLEMRAR